MGVAGAGKTTVGHLLAHELGWPFYDADDLHSPANIARMSSGDPLTELDREPWLASLEELVRGIDQRGESAVLACSALTESFRRRLAAAARRLTYVYLRVATEHLEIRLEQRKGHYMKREMLESQLRTLEEPSDDALVLDTGADSPQAVVERIQEALKL